MKKIVTILFFAVLLSAYNIKQFVTCKNVINLEPIDITTTFTHKDPKVYAFAYFTDIKKNTLIDFVWEKEVKGEWKLYADIQLPIFAGIRWRTYSNITIRDFFCGKWRVSIIDGNETIKTVNFFIKDINSSE